MTRYEALAAEIAAMIESGVFRPGERLPSTRALAAFPGPHHFPLDKLAVELGRGARRMDPWKTVEDLTPGSTELRRQIAKRSPATRRGCCARSRRISPRVRA
jgi:DNA-binding transcriptional MocR family regulator